MDTRETASALILPSLTIGATEESLADRGVDPSAEHLWIRTWPLPWNGTSLRSMPASRFSSACAKCVGFSVPALP